MVFPEWGEQALRNVAALFLPKLTRGNTTRQASGEVSSYVSELNQIDFPCVPLVSSSLSLHCRMVGRSGGKKSGWEGNCAITA